MPEPIRFLDVEGSPYEVGYAIGRAQRDGIRRVLDTLVMDGQDPGFIARRLAQHIDAFPLSVQELTGMAAGARVDMDELLAFNCLERSCSFSSGEERCTSIYWNRDGTGFIGHNEDEFVAYRGKMLLVHAHVMPTPVSSETRFLSLNYPGLLCGDSISLNDSGMVHAIDTLYPDDIVEEGFARGFLCRALLSSRSTQESHDILRRYPTDTGVHALIYSIPQARGLSVETKHRMLSGTALATAPAYAHSNAYIAPTSRGIAEHPHPIAAWKVARAQNLMRDLAAPSFENLRRVLTDHDGYPESICRHPSDGTAGATTTLASAIVDLNARAFLVANNNPCENDYTAFSL